MFRYACGTLLALLLPSAAGAAGTKAPRDAVDLSQTAVYNSPADIASWPVTTAITQLTMQPSGSPAAGLSFVFSAQNTWPDYTPPGWDGPLQYTVWAVVEINGQWNTSGFIQMWRGRASTGAPILTDFADDWAYDSRWGPMAGYQPQVGEQMGFFVSAGNARGMTAATSVRERSNVVLVALPASDTGVFTFPSSSRQATPGDFDGDGRSDLAVYRPSNGTGYIMLSASGTSVSYSGGRSTDIPVSGDFDGDGKADVTIYRPSDGVWGIQLSSSLTVVSYQWGVSTDTPVTGDYDGDGKTDIAVYRPATGTWYVLLSSTNFTSYVSYQWGISTDSPVPGDYDGDGKTDVAVYRPATGSWYIALSSTNFATFVNDQWGVSTDIPVASDYDGDGKADLAVYRPVTGTWYVLLSSTSSSIFVSYQWGISTDIPVPGDYDGDGKTDIAVFRPVSGMWYVLPSATPMTFVTYQWGIEGDVPLLRRP